MESVVRGGGDGWVGPIGDGTCVSILPCVCGSCVKGTSPAVARQPSVYVCVSHVIKRPFTVSRVFKRRKTFGPRQAQHHHDHSNAAVSSHILKPRKKEKEKRNVRDRAKNIMPNIHILSRILA